MKPIKHRKTRHYRCWYCLVKLINPIPTHKNNHDNLKTREHVVSVVDGGDSKPDNLRFSCRRCNNYVGNWPLERKLKFRVLVRKVGSVIELKKLGRRLKIEKIIDELPSPSDKESNKARLVLRRIELDMIAKYKQGKG